MVNNERVVVQFPRKNNSRNESAVFEGTKKSTEGDVLLIFDGEKFTLHKFASNYPLRFAEGGLRKSMMDIKLDEPKKVEKEKKKLRANSVERKSSIEKRKRTTTTAGKTLPSKGEKRPRRYTTAGKTVSSSFNPHVFSETSKPSSSPPSSSGILLPLPSQPISLKKNELKKGEEEESEEKEEGKEGKQSQCEKESQPNEEENEGEEKREDSSLASEDLNVLLEEEEEEGGEEEGGDDWLFQEVAGSDNTKK